MDTESDATRAGPLVLAALARREHALANERNDQHWAGESRPFVLLVGCQVC
jgi:hypothetical protein